MTAAAVEVQARVTRLVVRLLSLLVARSCSLHRRYQSSHRPLHTDEFDLLRRRRRRLRQNRRHIVGRR